MLEYGTGDTHKIAPGMELINAGTHFAGGTVLHWADDPEERGALFSGDIMLVTDRRWVSFMYSIPNFIPERPSTIRRALALVEPFAFERIYGAFWGRVVSARRVGCGPTFRGTVPALRAGERLVAVPGRRAGRCGAGDHIPHRWTSPPQQTGKPRSAHQPLERTQARHPQPQPDRRDRPSESPTASAGVLYYSGYVPFVGAGDQLRSWSFAVLLRTQLLDQLVVREQAQLPLASESRARRPQAKSTDGDRQPPYADDVDAVVELRLGAEVAPQVGVPVHQDVQDLDPARAAARATAARGPRSDQW